MLVGFMLTLCAFHWKEFFDKWLFRTLHLLGILYVGLLAILRQYCPLTILENNLRLKYGSGLKYPGSFIMRYIEEIVYPDVDSMVILIPTIFIALFTVIVFIMRPPAKIKEIFK